jgi:hypothetical protein
MCYFFDVSDFGSLIKPLKMPIHNRRKAGFFPVSSSEKIRKGGSDGKR